MVCVCVPSGVKRSELTALWCQCRVEYVYSFLWLKFLLKGYSNVIQIGFHPNMHFIYIHIYTHTHTHTFHLGKWKLTNITNIKQNISKIHKNQVISRCLD